MEHMGDILEQLKYIDVAVKCQKCGAVPTLVGKQYSIRCPSCGIDITLTPSYLAQLKQAEYQAKHGSGCAIRYTCDVCKDRGYVLLEEQIDELMYENGYLCRCEAGQRRDDLSGWSVIPASKFRGTGSILDTAEDVTDQTKGWYDDD